MKQLHPPKQKWFSKKKKKKILLVIVFKLHLPISAQHYTFYQTDGCAPLHNESLKPSVTNV